MTQPYIGVIAAAAKDDANRVWAAWGKGPQTFSRALTDDPSPTLESTVTHYLVADNTTATADIQIMQGFADGSLPPLAAVDAVWGEDGIIDQAAAIASVSAANFQCYTASGEVEPRDHCDAILASRGLRLVPDPS